MTELLGQYAGAGLQAALSGLLLWLIKRELAHGSRERAAAQAEHGRKLDKIYSRMDCFEAAQHACQLDNAKSFATKQDVAHIWRTVDGHGKDIAHLKGALGQGG